LVTVQIVILEVVTAGGLGATNLSDSNSNPAHAAIPHSLLQEAVAMVTGLTVDCCQALEAIEYFDRGCRSRPNSETEFPVGTRCVPWLLGSLFSTQASAESLLPQTVKTFWHQGEQNGSSLHPIDSNGVPFLNSELPRFEWSSADYLQSQVECWDPLREQRIVTVQVFLPAVSRWDLHAGHHSQPPAISAPTPSSSRTTLETIVVNDPARLVQQWKEAVKKSDAAILIAPQPDMQQWLAALDSLSSRVLAWPLDLLRRAEDKRYLTDVSSVVVGSDSHGWRFAANDSISPTNASDNGDVALKCFETHLAPATTWALKPTNQCGGSDVWRISLVAPLPEFANAKRILQRLRERVPCQTFGEQELLWSPWIKGEAGSLSLLATSTGWWCFPPCRQILKFEEVAVPSELLPWVKQLHKVNYVGSELDPQLLTSGTVDLLWRQFAAKLEHRERLSIRGWFGIDFVAATPEQATLIEVNPRLTSSYNLLRQLRWA
jgi:hypothetical protein